MWRNMTPIEPMTDKKICPQLRGLCRIGGGGYSPVGSLGGNCIESTAIANHSAGQT